MSRQRRQRPIRLWHYWKMRAAWRLICWKFADSCVTDCSEVPERCWIVTKESLERWLRSYGSAWEHRDARAAVDLFDENAFYSVLPFTPPLRGRQELLKYWQHVTSSQEQVQFDFEIVAVGPAEGVVHWWASFLRPREQKRFGLDGIFVLSLNAAGRCSQFREWWHKRETQLPSGEKTPGMPR